MADIASVNPKGCLQTLGFYQETDQQIPARNPGINVPTLDNTPVVVPKGMTVLFDEKIGLSAKNDSVIAVQLDPMKVLMPHQDQVFELNLPYVIAILRRPANTLALFFAKEPIVLDDENEDTMLYACCLPHVSSMSGSVCYAPGTNANHKSLNQDSLTAIIACLQVFFSGQNKYFLDVKFPTEFIERDTSQHSNKLFEFFKPPVMSKSHSDRYDVLALFKWWDGLTQDEVMNLSFHPVDTFHRMLQKIASLTQGQIRSWQNRFHHLEEDNIQQQYRGYI